MSYGVHNMGWTEAPYMIYYVFHAKFDKLLHLGDNIFWKSCDLDLTLKSLLYD